MDRIFMILKIKLTTGVHQSLPRGYIHEYVHISQTSLLVYQISGERLQDHWSSGYLLLYVVLSVISKTLLAMGTVIFILKVSNVEKVLKALF